MIWYLSKTFIKLHFITIFFRKLSWLRSPIYSFGAKFTLSFLTYFILLILNYRSWRILNKDLLLIRREAFIWDVMIFIVKKITFFVAYFSRHWNSWMVVFYFNRIKALIFNRILLIIIGSIRGSLIYSALQSNIIIVFVY